MSTTASDDFTVGVEEEYQLVDAESGELRSRARGVLAWDWTGEMKPEMHQNTLEVGTRVCRDSAEAGRELARLRLQAAVAADARGCRVVAAGMHPFSHWRDQQYTDAPVYHRIRQEYRRLADSQTIFGLHVHVGVPTGLDAVALMNTARLYLPHLLALTASSPLYLGDDTGYASYRSVLWSRWPRSGAPPRFRDGAEYAALVETMLRTGRIDTPGRIYWTMRPHHLYPTLEFRVSDVTPRLDDALAAVALARLIVAGVARGQLTEPDAPAATLDVLLEEGLWRAARDGLGAEIVALDGAAPRVVRLDRAIRDLVERLGPLASELGESERLASIDAVAARGIAADRIRAEARARALPDVVRWLADETVLGLGLDRRETQRPAD
jgi:glutamate---cysteine ligase / carboxylate-amine ligase